jgi:hypothetical protein
MLVYKCRACGGTGNRGDERECPKCDGNGCRKCKMTGEIADACFCCHNSGEHIGGVCGVDLRGARA